MRGTAPTTSSSAVAECVVKDGVNISFGVNPPFLWQHITGHYTNITVSTAGNNVQDAKGMTADVTLKDIRLQDSGDSKGTIGSLEATLAWKSAGIKDTLAANLPGVGNLITGVSTDSAAGTIIVDAGDNKRDGQARSHRRRPQSRGSSTSPARCRRTRCSRRSTT